MFLILRLKRFKHQINSTMKIKPSIITLYSIIFCSLMLSCKKEEVVEENAIIAGAGYDIVNLTINGKKYDESKSLNIHFTRDNQKMCDTKKGREEAIGCKTPDSRFSVSFYLLYQRINTDFKNSKAGNYSISDYSNIINYLQNDTGPCNLHLYATLDDNGKSAKFYTGSHAVPKITLLKTGSQYTDYEIEGTFTSVFVNSNKENITMTGTYKKVIQVFNQ